MISAFARISLATAYGPRMVLSLIPFAIGFLLAFVVFTTVRRTGRLSSEFSTIAATIMFGPILVSIADIIATSVLVFTGPPPEQHFSLTMLAAALTFSLMMFGPTVLVLVPLLSFYLLRAWQKKRSLPVSLVSIISICCIAAQLVWLSTLANELD
jgi:hypothetical protein